MTEPAPDPRRRRIFVIGAALLAGVALWNVDWWDGEEDEGIIQIHDEEISDSIKERIREEIREAAAQDRGNDAADSE